MHRSLLLLSALSIGICSTAQNDCSSSLLVGLGNHAVNYVNGSPTIPCMGEPAQYAVWYRYVADVDTGVVVTTDIPLNSGGDTRVHIYTGTCSNLVCLASDDDSGSGFLSTVTFNVTAGTTYFIVFDSYWSPSGFVFDIHYSIPVIPPANAISFSPTPSGIGSSSCVIDMNGDHLDDIVNVTNQSVTVARQLAGGGFSNLVMPTPLAAHMPSWSIAAGDINGDGRNDLMYGGGSGATFMIQDATGTSFIQQPFTEYIFCQRTNMVDINNDGFLDAFSCHDVAPNVYFLNNGTGTLTFYQGGLGPNGGNYGSLWTDYDNDGDVDMFVSKCGSSPPDILMRNNGDGSFTDVAMLYGMADGHQSWSSAWGDFDNDGDMDVMIGKSSSPNNKFLRNDLVNGEVTFTDVTAGSGFDTYSGSGIEWVTHDFNNDGWLDVMGGGGILFSNGDMTFSAQAGMPMNGPVGDLNNDGFLDVVNGSSIYFNNGNENNWLKVHLVGTISNMSAIGARIQIQTPMGTQMREIRSGDGFATMSSLTAHFGIGQDTEISTVTIHWPSGIVQTIQSPEINTTLVIVEEISTAVGEHAAQPLLIHPNPATEFITVANASNNRYSIYDAVGALVKQGSTINGRIAVNDLSTGQYMLQVRMQDGSLKQERFNKL